MTVSSPERGSETVDTVLADKLRMMKLTQVGIKAMGRKVDIDLTDKIKSVLSAGKTGVLAVKNFHIRSIAAETYRMMCLSCPPICRSWLA